MNDGSSPVALARPFIEQCHREIEVAWLQIEAAREVLARGRWLLARWSEQSRVEKSIGGARPGSFERSEAARIGMFVMVEPEIRRHRKRRKRSGRGDVLRTARSRGARQWRTSNLQLSATPLTRATVHPRGDEL